MTVEDLQAGPWSAQPWSVPAAGDSRFSWEYDVERQRLLNLYQKGKDKQWDAQRRIDWDLPLDDENPLGMPVEIIPIVGIAEFEKRLSEPGELTRVRRALSCMQISQFLHGEQGAMITGARIVETVPDIDAKFYAATQTMDEALDAGRPLGEREAVPQPVVHPDR